MCKILKRASVPLVKEYVQKLTLNERLAVVSGVISGVFFYSFDREDKVAHSSIAQVPYKTATSNYKLTKTHIAAFE